MLGIKFLAKQTICKEMVNLDMFMDNCVLEDVDSIEWTTQLLGNNGVFSATFGITPHTIPFVRSVTIQNGT